MIDLKKGKSIVLGADGLIGRQIANTLHSLGADYIGTSIYPVQNKYKLDITNFAETSKLFSEVRPDFVFHCANLAGGVDLCEREKEKAKLFHLGATENLLELCEKLGASFSFISTDYVFDDKQAVVDETSPTNPLNYYGEIKLQAEQLITEKFNESYVFRTTNVFGWDPETHTPNFLMNLYRTIAEGRPANVPSFLQGTPTPAFDLAEAIIAVLGSGKTGLYHAVGSDYLDRYSWALMFCEAAKLEINLINEIKAPPAGMVARPMHVQMDTKKIEQVLGRQMLGVQAGINKMIQDSQV